MEEFLIKATQFILSLSILIVLHELGHFIPAKLFKTRVEKFYLFFDPWFSLFKIKKGGTEYGIGWLPLGGYVKISGMIDESMDKEQLKREPQPWEFRSKPAWQRLIIMVGGVTVNLLLGMFIYAMLLFAWGERKLPVENMKDGVWAADSLAKEMGFQDGDKILAIDGQKVKYYSDIVLEMMYAKEVEVMRDGELKEIEIPGNFIEKLIDQGRSARLFLPRMPFTVAGFSDTSNAKEAGLEKGDRIIAVNGREIKYFDEFKDFSQNNKGEVLQLKVKRDDAIKTFDVKVSDEGIIGVMPGFYTLDGLDKAGVYEFENKKYGFLAAFPAGINKALDRLQGYIKTFKLLFNPETGAYKGLGGFATIGDLFPATWNWRTFWELTAFISLILAFMNILPIPALDGGHVMFLIYEMVAGRKPSDKFMEYAQIAGMVLLISLLVIANGNDFYRYVVEKYF